MAGSQTLLCPCANYWHTRKRVLYKMLSLPNSFSFVCVCVLFGTWWTSLSAYPGTLAIQYLNSRILLWGQKLDNVIPITDTCAFLGGKRRRYLFGCYKKNKNQSTTTKCHTHTHTQTSLKSHSLFLKAAEPNLVKFSALGSYIRFWDLI